MKYVCELCGRIYDETAGDMEHGISAGTAFSALPAEYECPDCGSGKEAYVQASSGASAGAASDEAFHSQR